MECVSQFSYGVQLVLLMLYLDHYCYRTEIIQKRLQEEPFVRFVGVHFLFSNGAFYRQDRKARIYKRILKIRGFIAYKPMAYPLVFLT